MIESTNAPKIISSGPCNTITEGGADEQWLFDNENQALMNKGPSNSVFEGGAGEDWLFGGE